MIWPSPEKATLLILGGTLDLAVRPPQATDALLSPLPGPESAPPEKPTRTRHGDVRIERIDRIGLELGTQSKSQSHVEEDDPPQRSGRTATDRDDVAGRMTQMRLSCTRDVFLLQGSLRAWEGANEVLSSRLGSLYSSRLLMTILLQPRASVIRSSIRYHRGKAVPARMPLLHWRDNALHEHFRLTAARLSSAPVRVHPDVT